MEQTGHDLDPRPLGPTAASAARNTTGLWSTICRYTATRRRDAQEARLWASADTVSDLGALMARFALGELHSWPGHAGPYDPETEDPAEQQLMRRAVAHLNVAGYLTTGGQAGLDEPSADDTDCPHARWKQRATIEGHAPMIVLDRLRELVSPPLVMIAHPTRRWLLNDYTSSVDSTTFAGQVLTGFGVELSRREIVGIWDGIGRHLIDEIIAMHQVTIYDERFGPNRTLWERLLLL